MARKSAEGAADKAGMVEWLLHNSRDLMHVAGLDGVFRVVNPAWCEMTGLSEAELLGRRCTDFYHPDDVPDVRDRARRGRPGDVSEGEIRVSDGKGGWRWFRGRREVMADGSHVVMLRDDTADRAYRQEIEEARRARKMLGAAAGIGIWSFDPIANVIWWSDELIELLGFDPDVVWTPDRFYETVHPRDRASMREALTRAVQDGENVRLEHRVQTPRGWSAMRVTVRPQRVAEGVHRLRGISEDITELAGARDLARREEQRARRARREVQANASRLGVALGAAEAGVYEIDHVKHTFWCSPEFERITGQTKSSYDEAVDLRYPGFHPDDLPHIRASFPALHRGDKRSGESFEARILRPDGTERWVRVFHHLEVAKNGRWLKAGGLIQDCDALKRQELALEEARAAAEAAGEAKAAFLANMSHEIRTPLNGVMGVLHLLKGERLSGDGRALLSEALSCGAMLAELLNDVIDFSKIEAGLLELSCEPVDPVELADGVVRLLEPQARAKGLELIVQHDPGLGWVVSDPIRLRQALFNLIGNAVKFTESGHVLVRTLQPRPDVLRFEIEDTGVGIPAAARARLFERFHQADASTTRRFGGSGLGLAITRRLAELMQGSVDVSSIEGEGSIFRLEVRAPTAAAPPEAADEAQPVLDGARVLVVEDNPTNRMIATKLLENLGADVETASDGYAGVEAVERGGFDLILMDIQMPGIDGLEAARRIRALGGPSAATPIVALTANVLAHQRQAYLDADMDGVVGKPIAPAVLLAEIAAAVARRDAVIDRSAAA